MILLSSKNVVIINTNMTYLVVSYNTYIYLKFYKKKKQYLTNWAICIFAEIKFAFEVYDFKGDGKVDAFYIGDLIRACNLNPTNNTIYNMCGGLQEKSKKMITIDEMYPIFKTAKDSKDTGGIHDFVEILKLYDKNEDKTILSKDLFRLLTNLGMLFISSSLYVMYFVRGCGGAEWCSSAHCPCNVLICFFTAGEIH